ncbi:MAG TPA: bacteriohopanetetrol glucosamine biosynthesis glycosyltransferase HpnI [Rhizomicrobium sp.]|nr:bacteriohopanetetrol glucosamine biosynthesis glycosyltransferase HpnI [Rhizomicrobium sp.]
MAMLFVSAGWLLCGLALCGAAYAMAAAFFAGRFMRAEVPPAPAYPPVTILKPLHLNGPGLSDNLESFFVQDYPGQIQIVFGVHDEEDPAIPVVEALQARYPGFDATIVADSALYGFNAKVSNLVNMLPAAKHATLVLSDGDIIVSRSWLRQVADALARPGVGLVTCLYTGEVVRGDKSLWSTLAAMGSTYDFLPNVILATTLDLAKPCMGSTIALTRGVLDEIGGFGAYTDFLADDYEIGRAVRAKGYAVAIPAMSVGHLAFETSLRDLVRHEVRWTRTIRMVDSLGHLGSVVTFGFPIALLAALLLGFNTASLVVILVTLLARLFLKRRIDDIFATHAGPFWLLPLRDVLSFAVFVTSRFGETIYWRGSRYSIETSGALSQF